MNRVIRDCTDESYVPTIVYIAIFIEYYYCVVFQEIESHRITFASTSGRPGNKKSI